MSAVHLTTWGRPRCRLYQCGPRSSGRQVTRYRVFAGYLNRLCIPSARRRSVARRAASLRRLSRTTLSVCGGRIANSCRPGILEQQARREKDLRPFLPSAFLEGSRGRGEAAGRRCFCQLLSPDLLCWPTTQSNMDRSFFPDQIMYGVDEGSPEICRCIVMDPPPNKSAVVRMADVIAQLVTWKAMRLALHQCVSSNVMPREIPGNGCSRKTCCHRASRLLVELVVDPNRTVEPGHHSSVDGP